MLVPPKKNQYALRAIFELAKHMDQGPVKISEIATAQSIPLRFLEVILNQLKASGIVDSKRGFYGGYFLVKPPNQVSVGDVMRFLSRDLSPSDCIACVSKTSCPFDGQCAFSSMWIRVKQATFNIYDETSFQDLIDREQDAGWSSQQ
ncbi:Rrf2 family transcriptional regulator [Desulfosarcina sp.]|uniref:RrF2 family transcriptional regulator n=1 Tax=Desulfosarcina sp. TaxID=2027861 RepID=UPI0029A529B2|nr:Rrf2 family transcriptional regulator [Desulfosarcina sp.]MDX2455527.1 Rrf2 family transcriptional regulator [Desulfosarcina sp.]MDX2493016.1 Rrf2 family transcriptional regulator [Desulfosarcina sp.]